MRIAWSSFKTVVVSILLLLDTVVIAYVLSYMVWSRCFAWHFRVILDNGSELTRYDPKHFRYDNEVFFPLFIPLCCVDYAYTGVYYGGLLQESDWQDLQGGMYFGYLGKVEEFYAIRWPLGENKEPMHAVY